MTSDHRGGNGNIMRQSSLPLATFGTASLPLRAWAAYVQSCTTHATPSCVQASVLLNEMCLALMRGEPIASVLAPRRFAAIFADPVVRTIPGLDGHLEPVIAAIVDAEYATKVGPAHALSETCIAAPH
mgnify:CR=1 FL=1